MVRQSAMPARRSTCGRIRTGPAERAVSTPAAAIGAIEDMTADLLHLFHGSRPARMHVSCMIVRRGADFRQPDLARRDSKRDIFGDRPRMFVGHAVAHTVA